MNATTRNVTRAYRAASEAHRAAGITWYARARDLAEELDSADVERAAAVIAVLSQRTRWDLNVTLARQAYEMTQDYRWHGTAGPNGLLGGQARARIAYDLPVMGLQREKVARLLVDREEPDDVVTGPKIRAFWRTIVDPSDPRAVVVDRHAVDVAVGRVMSDAERGKLLGRKGAYDTVALCYSRAARILSVEYGATLTPAAVQAVTWTYWRETRAHQRAHNVRSNGAGTSGTGTH